MDHKVGDLQVWWIPQVPGTPFEVPVESVQEAVKIMRVLADYDEFQFRHNIKPDYCNAGGLREWSSDCDGEGNPGWEDWWDEETGEEDPEKFLIDQARDSEPVNLVSYANKVLAGPRREKDAAKKS